jgi:hypothetical protein
MSALGQKQTCASQKAMSALPPIADMCSALVHVRFVPKADSCSAAKRSLFDELIGSRQNRCRNHNSQTLGRLQIDHEFKLSRIFGGQFTWLGTV